MIGIQQGNGIAFAKMTEKVSDSKTELPNNTNRSI